MVEKELRILQVSTADIGGGAEKVASDLFHAYRRRGFDSSLAVGMKVTADPDVIPIPNESQRSQWAKLWLGPGAKTEAPNQVTQLARLSMKVAEPWRTVQQLIGREDFDFPGSWQLLKLNRSPPTIVHCHNLHGDYFDLRALPWLTSQLPVFFTLHDAWLLSGHCAHSFECDRWVTGCGNCPDLTIYPAIRRDATAYNWRRKRDIFQASQIFLATPCRWLMDKVNESILRPAIQEAKVIPYGIDTSIFRPLPKSKARAMLGLSPEARVLLFTANRIRTSIWKDYAVLREAVTRAAAQTKTGKLVFIALGEEAPSENLGEAEVRFIPFQRNPEDVARFYQAADIYVHAARADTFPNAILEALACGTPVVATAIGGIPEQIEHGQTGFLVPPGDAPSMTRAIIELLDNDDLRERMGKMAAETAQVRFSLDREVDDYLGWYQESLSKFHQKLPT